MDDSGKPDSHLYSHSYIVTPSQNTVFRAANIVRKAILCLQTPDDCSAWTIFVHLFQFLQKLSMFHITLNRGDMVIIRDTCDQTWLGHIQSITAL